MGKAKYTFLIPAFKSQYLTEMLRSIKAQTYTDFAVIVSDDCSPEILRTVFDDVVGDDRRFSFRRNEQNMGSKSLVSHWNLLLELCQTEYFIMSSDDDLYHPAFLEEIDALIQKYPDVDIYRARCCTINGVGDVIREDIGYKEYTNQLEYLSNMYSPFIRCEANYVYRTSTMKDYNGFIETPVAWGADDIVHIRQSKKGVCNTSSILFSFRLSDYNITSKGITDGLASKKVDAFIILYNWFRNNVKRDALVVDERSSNLFDEMYDHFLAEVKDCLFFIRYMPMRLFCQYVPKVYRLHVLSLRNWLFVFKMKLFHPNV